MVEGHTDPGLRTRQGVCGGVLGDLVWTLQGSDASSFHILLRTDPLKAYEYGKVLLVTSTYRIPPYYVLFNGIKGYSGEKTLPPQIYELGAEAYQARIDYSPKTNDLPKTYHIMADWYWRAHDTSKAIETEEKAIVALKTTKHGSGGSLAAFESRLQQYKNLLRSEGKK